MPALASSGDFFLHQENPSMTTDATGMTKIGGPAVATESG